ncbi:MAG: DUF3108 domain-containing protein [Cytophagia bacterium]|nr:DUF3108 domain-containing protein [Cytophagia bacterium]
MFKKRILFLYVVLLFGFSAEKEEIYPAIKNDSFKRGEYIKYKLTYGFFSVGRGHAVISDKYYSLNGRSCFKLDAYGTTAGMLILPEVSYRIIREGNYKLDEYTYFDHENKKVAVKVIDNKTGKFKEPKEYETNLHTRDMVAGFLYMRTLDFSKMQKGDTVMIKGFFEDTFYKQAIVYYGKDVVKMKFGKVRALKFKPVMPDNKLFDGENSITAWFSDDKNRIPLKIDAEMFIGSAGVELTDYGKLKHPLNLVK